MSRRSQPWLRLPVHLAVGAVLLLMALAPRHPLTVCTGDECCSWEAANEPEPTCDCCRSRSDDGARPSAPGGQHRGLTCADCCVDLALPIEPGPLPDRADAAPPVPPAAGLDASLAAIGAAHGKRTPAGWHLDTGPPRADPRTRLLVTTVLRQ